MKRISWLSDSDVSNYQQAKQIRKEINFVEPKLNKLENIALEQKNELTLEDLPDELILKIISKLDYRFHNCLRCASRRLNRLYTQHMLHCFRANTHQSERQRHVNKELAVTYEILHEATKYYVDCGYESAFCGALSVLFHQLNCEPKPPQSEKILRFLERFYKMVEMRPQQEVISTKERFVYILTFVSMLRKFRTFKLVRSRRQGMHWHFAIEVPGIGLGILWWKERLVSNYPRKRAQLLAIICKLAHDHLMNEQLQYIWEKSNVVYLYGHLPEPHRQRAIQTSFDLMIYAHDEIVQLLRSVLELNVPAKLPACMPKAPFIANMSIKSARAIEWGCRESINLQIGPLSFGSCEQFDSDSDKES